MPSPSPSPFPTLSPLRAADVPAALALQSLDVGTAFNAGLAIVVMAIVLDRVTTAASVREG